MGKGGMKGGGMGKAMRPGGGKNLGKAIGRVGGMKGVTPRPAPPISRERTVRPPRGGRSPQRY